ncbi:unnamed protein product, partial [Adineta steineri]
QRLNNLLLQHQHYINHLQLPTTNFDTSKNILSVIESRIELINITSIDLPFPLEYFSNLKSIIISTPYGLSKDQMKLIFKKQFYLTQKQPSSYRNNLNELINGIQQFSSSLICLSLNLFECDNIRENEIPFNGVKLQQLLESMIELEQFHLYATLNSYDNSRNVLSQFQDQYWFDHKWTFEMHGTYFYTLPFHFEYLHEFYELILEYDSNEEVKSHVTLDNITTIQFDHGSVENGNEWLIQALPNLNHLILSTVDLPSPDSQSVDLLNKRIRRLDINSTDSLLEQLTEISYVYFSNIEHIYFERSQSYADIVKKILKNFKSLERLIIRSLQELYECRDIMTSDLTNILEHSDMVEIKKKFQMKQLGG